MFLRRVVLLWSCVLSLVLCGGVLGCQSPQEKLAAKRASLRELQDELYARYGGSDVAAELDKAARAQPATDNLAALMGQAIGNAARETDREVFVQDCLRQGHGEHVAFLTDKGRAFFEQSSTKKSCEKLAALSDEVAQMQAELGVPGNGTGTP